MSPVLRVKALSAGSLGTAAERDRRTSIVPESPLRRPTFPILPPRLVPERFRSGLLPPRLPCRVRRPPIHSARRVATVANGRRVPWGGGPAWRGPNYPREPLCRFESAGRIGSRAPAALAPRIRRSAARRPAPPPPPLRGA